MTTYWLLSLAVWEIIEIWKHGSIFASWRARLEASESRLRDFGQCGFCLAPWIALLVCSLWQWQEYLCQHDYTLPGTAIYLGIVAFAVARLANLGNDISHRWCRTPKNVYDVKEDENNG